MKIPTIKWYDILFIGLGFAGMTVLALLQYTDDWRPIPAADSGVIFSLALSISIFLFAFGLIKGSNRFIEVRP